VRIVDSTLSEKTIRLNASAAFQLLVAAESQAVREAAAEALWPRDLAALSQLDCNDVPFESLPYAERALALLVAAVIEANPRQATRLRVQPLYRFLTPGWETGSTRVFRMRRNAPDQRVVTLLGGARAWRATSAFVLPQFAEDTVRQLCGWGTEEQRHYRRSYPWVVGAEGARLDIPSRVKGRARRSWETPVLISHAGERLCTLDQWVNKLFTTSAIELDSSLILRLCAGGLAGSVISFSNQLPIVRGRRPRDATLSIEIGPSIESIAVGAFFKGDLDPRYDLTGVLPSARVRVGLVGGQTIDALHDIAQHVGVWHGERIRGSFLHHPLRKAPLQEVA
jgi:hypothetical protein